MLDRFAISGVLKKYNDEAKAGGVTSADENMFRLLSCDLNEAVVVVFPERVGNESNTQIVITEKETNGFPVGIKMMKPHSSLELCNTVIVKQQCKDIEACLDCALRFVFSDLAREVAC